MAWLVLPRLSKESYDELDSFWIHVGGGYPNPIDTGNENRTQIKRIMEILERDNNVENLVFLTNANYRTQTPELVERNIRLMGEIRNRTWKPVMELTSRDVGYRRRVSMRVVTG